MSWCPEQMWPRWQCLFLIAPANVPLRLAKRHDRLSWKVSTTALCGVLWWQDRVRGGSSRLEIKLRSGGRARGRCMRHGHVRWRERAVVLALCPGSKNVWVAYSHQLLKVSQEQLRMATTTERVADDVVHQKLRAIGETKVSGHIQRSTATIR